MSRSLLETTLIFSEAFYTMHMYILTSTFAPTSIAFPLSARSPHLGGFIAVIFCYFLRPMAVIHSGVPPDWSCFHKPSRPHFHTWSRALSSVPSLFHCKFCNESHSPPRYLSNAAFYPGSSVWVLLRQDPCKPAWTGTHCIQDILDICPWACTPWVWQLQLWVSTPSFVWV